MRTERGGNEQEPWNIYDEMLSHVFAGRMSIDDARLITAAPELLEVLEGLLACSMADPARNRSNEGQWLTINARAELVEKATAVIKRVRG